MDFRTVDFRLSDPSLKAEIRAVRDGSISHFEKRSRALMPEVWISCYAGLWRASISMLAITADRLDENNNGVYGEEKLEELTAKLKTHEFWDPMLIELEKLHNERLSSEADELRREIPAYYNFQDFASDPNERAIDLVVRVVVDKDDLEAVQSIPSKNLGAHLMSSLPTIIRIWKMLKSKGLSDDEASALLGGKVEADLYSQ